MGHETLTADQVTEALDSDFLIAITASNGRSKKLTYNPLRGTYSLWSNSERSPLCFPLETTLEIFNNIDLGE